MTGQGVVAVVPTELEAGFRLAGVDTVATTGGEETASVLERLTADASHGVVAVYEPFLAGLPLSRRAELEASISPVVVSLPAGLEEYERESHRIRIAAMLSHAVGYHITFGEEAPS